MNTPYPDVNQPYLGDITGSGDLIMGVILTVFVLAVYFWVEHREKKFDLKRWKGDK